MARPVISLKTKRPQNAPDCPKCEGWLIYRITHDDMGCVKCDHAQPLEVEEVKRHWPEDWTKGQLLNVRRSGDNYVVTLLNEELDPQHPERALFFSNSFDCQSFISVWYSRDNVDPRAG